MKRILLATCILALSISLSAQKVVINEIDKFTKERHIETNFANVRQQFTCVMQFKLRASGDYLFFTVRGSNCGAGVIGDDDYILLLMDDESTVRLKSTGIQSYQITDSGFGIDKPYTHQYYISQSDMDAIKSHTVKSLRISYDDVFQDFEVNKHGQENIKELFNNFTAKL